ncbi:DUF4307 domain-containing protein [Gulosibacter sp. 10]|uniref:DUF4307 domain-containing protein n=1 Tax=Gulosibacter sp. 10 TaxID=1255570 RepID=UPI00097E8DA1|nr:DUF4307 domain-containing protein [Gulosibacter sp. 10]SJM66572.1 hypothetical protein FM112_11880 [Gulosibacter sp. 10]
MTDLDARYGTSRRAAGRVRPGVWWTLLAVLVLGVIGFWALSLTNPGGTIETSPGRFEVHSDTEAHLDARVSVQPGTELACTVEAQNAVNAVVGFETVVLPPAEEQHQTLSVTLRTTQAATLLLVRECWIP